ncbi:MAG: LamG domain-containing protein, partial [Bacteroidales bacterium]|nr:LamG domain-containing protein [Bacteroidales bacterium]
MIGGSITGTSIISNTGCDILNITALTHTDNEFAVSLNDYSLQPGESATLTHVFQPVVTGVHIDTIRLTNYLGTFEYLVKGTALSAPELEINPSTLTANITGCDDSASATLQVINGGNAPLHWTVPSQVSTNYALMFNGSNDYVQLGTWHAGATWTLEAWVNPASVMTGQRTIVGGVHQCADWAVTVKDGVFALVIKPQNAICSHTATSTVQAVPGVWYHVAAVNTGTQARLYVNGNLALTTSVSPYYLGTPSGVRIGGEYCCYGNSFHGIIDEVRIWKTARSQSQILANMYNSLSGSEASLEGYWPMNEGSGATAHDHGTMGHDGLIYGPLWTNQVWLDDWVLTQPSSGTVPANDTAIIQVEFYSGGLYSGTFYRNLLIETDDPLHPMVSIPCTLDVIGEAEMHLQPLCIYFNATMQYAQSTGQVFISNSGCDTLNVISAVSTNPAFTPAVSSFTVLPGYSYPLTVTFAPTATGIHAGDLVLTTSIGPGTVCLNGTAIDRPVADLQGTSFFGQPACDFRDTAYIVLQNLGAAPLNVGYTIAPAVSWGHLISTPPVIAPFGQESLGFVFNKTGMNPGNYSTTLSLQTNDPLNPSFHIPVQMNVPNVLAPVNLGRDTGSCIGLSLTLNAGAGYSTYLWSTGSTSNLATVNTSGNYSVTVTDAFGCVSTDQVYAGFYPYPTAFAGNDTSGCANYSHLLSGSATGLSQAQPTDIVIGSGTDFTNNTVATPFKTYFMDGRTQMLYTKAELNAAGFDQGPITSIGFKVSTPGGLPMHGFSIHMATTSINSISGFQPANNLVFYSPSYNATSGWNMFTLQTPFYWDGTQNLIIQVCFDNASYQNNATMEYTVTGGKVWGAGCDDCDPGCLLGGGSSSNMRVNLRIIGENDPSNYWWTGPAGFYADYKLAQVNNLSSGQAGQYTFHVDNGWGCVGT